MSCFKMTIFYINWLAGYWPEQPMARNIFQNRLLMIGHHSHSTISTNMESWETLADLLIMKSADKG